ncbi:hypothetical protein BGX24_008026, partial [Mortierella sp. AD032]
NDLHKLLYDAPLLEHLRTGSISHYIDNLDLDGLLPGTDDPSLENNNHNRDDNDQVSVSSQSTFESHYVDPLSSSRRDSG